MGFRQYDFECRYCHNVVTDLMWVDHGATPAKTMDIECTRCNEPCTHDRIISMPAQYLYDRPYAPVVYGGKYDTQGYRKLPPMPKLPDDCAFDKARDILGSKEAKEARKERAAVLQENAQKRARAKAMKASPGSVDLRKNPLPGDPKM